VIRVYAVERQGEKLGNGGIKRVVDINYAQADQTGLIKTWGVALDVGRPCQRLVHDRRRVHCSIVSMVLKGGKDISIIYL